MGYPVLTGGRHQRGFDPPRDSARFPDPHQGLATIIVLVNDDANHMEILRELLEHQLLGVLGTHRDGEPYTSLVGFAATPDLATLYFATGRSTRKLANLESDARASMLIDNRTNAAADFTEASAATAVGLVEEVEAAERGAFDEVFLAKHPHLSSFVRSPSCVALRLRVSVYMVVTRFQHVIELHVEPE